MSDLNTGIMQKNKKGKIIVKRITGQKIYLWAIWTVLVSISVYTLLTIDTGNLIIGQAFKDFFRNIQLMFFQARLSDRYTYIEIFHSLVVSISIAVITTIIGSAIALLLAFFAARNLSSERVSGVIKVCMSFIRAVPTILWVMVFSVVASIGVEAAILGMTFHSVAYLVKAYSESIEEIDRGIIEALKSTGASWWLVIFQGVMPSTIASVLSWTFVRFEINFTNAVVVGAASGAGGIGYEMFMAGTMYFDIKEIGFFTYLIFSVAIILERISVRLRKKYIIRSK